MKKFLFWLVPFMMGNVCHAEDITVRYNGAKAIVKQQTKDSVSVTVDGASVSIESQYKEHQITLLLTGKSDNGQLTLKTAGKAKVKLDNLTLTSKEGAPLCLKNKKKVEVVAAKGTTNSLTITACNDTANHKAATIWAKDKLLLSGKGTLHVVATGDGCRGIKTKKDITIEELTLHVTTSGNNLGEKPFGFGGGFPNFGNDSIPFGGFPGFGNDSIPFGGFPGFGNDSIRMGGFPMPDFSKFPMPFGMSQNDSIPFQGFPGFGGDSIPFQGFPSFGGDSIPFGGGFAGKHKYVASTKGITSKGKIIINSGNIHVRTSTPGAEGIEGKKGIAFNGGHVNIVSLDDAINANATIEFNGAEVIARSMGNDAVDANPEGGFFPPFGGNGNQKMEPLIIITGGTVYAWSQVGSPEEGLDSDFSPLAIKGGKVFSVGGSIGDAPSVPTNETAHQPTVLLTDLKVVKDEPINIYDDKGKLIDTVKIPFSMKRSASIVSSPHFKVGNRYSVKTKDYEKTFTLSEPFTTVR